MEMKENPWISVEKKLPEEGEVVFLASRNIHRSGTSYTSGKIERGRTKEEMVGAKVFHGCDEWGNNLRPYCWYTDHGKLFGQEVHYWMPIPELP